MRISVGKSIAFETDGESFDVDGVKSTFARTSGGMTCARSTAITFLSQLFARPPQFFNHLQHAQMLSRALFERQLQVFAQQCAIHIAYEIGHAVGVRSN